MGTEACPGELMKEEILSQNFISISISKVADKTCGIVEAKNVIVLSQSSTPAADHRQSIGPLTPDSNRENGELDHDFSSPLTLVSSTLNASTQSNHPTSPDGNSSETPKETLFDSFAPGPDNVLLAPHHRKYREESRIHVVRRLNFLCETHLVRDISHESNMETISDEEHLFEIVYDTILDAIVSEQTKELGAKFPTRFSGLDGFRTPKSAPHLSGIAETCPAAPVKSTNCQPFQFISKLTEQGILLRNNEKLDTL
ncbi:hypothetical protein DH2020_036799 [Rehmannia glutinosa]|uniref:Uncharacterized protein n=1 Tax=Rehmannia glutinosa TaxID=99300 RepID=A0ABR0V2J8_REHGL